MGGALGEVEIVSQKDVTCLALVLVRPQKAGEVCSLNGVEQGRCSVEHHEFWLGEQSQGEYDTLKVSLTQFGRPALEGLGLERQRITQLTPPLVGFSGLTQTTQHFFVQSGDWQNRVENFERLLKGNAQAFTKRFSTKACGVKILPFEQNAPEVRRVQAGDHVGQR